MNINETATFSAISLGSFCQHTVACCPLSLAFMCKVDIDKMYAVCYSVVELLLLLTFATSAEEIIYPASLCLSVCLTICLSVCQSAG